MDSKKKFLPVIKVGGRRVVKKANPTRECAEKLKKILESNKKLFAKSSIEEAVLEKSSKLCKYKNNIKVVFNSNNVPVGLLLSGLPEVRSKVVLDIPDDFETAVDNLNIGLTKKLDRLDEALDID
ncbi:hypothetical protein NGRA_0724 [Nosema granulosis]|uniref:Uncharacterized protein n=1 Tax=Nosema granulosis TaxID=83296 RepID=A0A9P6GZT2_9MICR|nr:hypothetical protein NGRA_0724 [Nosema granulosis]